MAKNSQGKTGFARKIVIVLLLAVVLGVSCIFSAQIDKLLGIGYKGSNKGDEASVFASDLIVNYLDVGQGDSTYIEFPNGETMLIDASESEYGDKIVDYMRGRQGLEEDGDPVIDYLILTHSDADHVGGMETILTECIVNNIYRPFQLAMKNDDSGECILLEDLKSYNDLIATNTEKIEGISKIYTAAYRKFIELIYQEDNEQGEPANVYVPYTNHVIGGTVAGFTFEFFAHDIVTGKKSFENNTAVTMTKGFPIESYTANNNASPIMLLEYGEHSFVFTGDAEKEVEEDFLNSLTTDVRNRFSDVSVYKAGHHGSSTSSTAPFLALMQQTYTIVSCGLNNKHNHPSSAFVKRLEALNHKVDDYLIRTDLNGNIVFGAKDSVLIYVAGVEVAVGKVVHWYHIAIVVFVALSIVILSIKFKKDGSVTKGSVERGNRTAKKVVKKYFK